MRIRSYPNDQIILALVLLLSGFGIVMMYSASSMYAMNRFDNYLHFFIQQIKWLSVGALLMLTISRINYQILKKIAYGLIFFSKTISMVFFPGIHIGFEGKPLFLYVL